MSSISSGITRRAQATGIAEEIKLMKDGLTQLETKQTNTIKGVQAALAEIHAKFDEITERLDAIISLVGADEVTKVVNDTRTEVATKQMESEKASIAEGVKDGYLALTDRVTETSLLVGVPTGPAGEPIIPGWCQFALSQIDQALRPNFLDKAVGDSGVYTNRGWNFKITEIYSVDINKYNATQETKKQEAAAKQAEADLASLESALTETAKADAPATPATEAPATGTP